MPLSKLLFSFDGRIRRSHYWAVRLLAPLAAVAIWLGFGLVAYAITGGRSEANTPEYAPLRLVIGLMVIAVLGLLTWVDIAAGVKRCHDRNKSGWFLLVSFIPLVGFVWLLVELGFLDGDPGRNRFGPSPKFPQTAETFA